MEHFTAGIISYYKWNVLCIPSKGTGTKTLWEFYLNRNKMTHLMFMFGAEYETEEEATRTIYSVIEDYTDMYWDEVAALEGTL